MAKGEGTFDRQPEDGNGMEQGYTICSLPTKTPGVAAGDLLKPYSVTHDYTMPPATTLKALSGLGPKLEQNGGDYKAFPNGPETFKDSDAEWKR